PRVSYLAWPFPSLCPPDREAVSGNRRGPAARLDPCPPSCGRHLCSRWLWLAEAIRWLGPHKRRPVPDAWLLEAWHPFRPGEHSAKRYRQRHSYRCRGGTRTGPTAPLLPWPRHAHPGQPRPPPGGFDCYKRTDERRDDGHRLLGRPGGMVEPLGATG